MNVGPKRAEGWRVGHINNHRIAELALEFDAKTTVGAPLLALFEKGPATGRCVDSALTPPRARRNPRALIPTVLCVLGVSAVNNLTDLP